MLLGRVRKQPNETRRYVIDFGKLRLGAGEYITAIVAGVSPDTLPVIVATTSLVQAVLGDITSATCAYVYVSGGLDGTTYRITLTSSPDDTNIIWEDELEVKVEEL